MPASFEIDRLYTTMKGGKEPDLSDEDSGEKDLGDD